MHLFGLTGGIASGKSTVARRFRQRGLPVIDADELARDVVTVGSEGLRAIVERFGEDVLAADGSLDRKRLAARVFEDAEALRALNGITHPRISALAVERARLLAERGEPLACYEVPLLYETGAARALTPVVVVSASLEHQIARSTARDAATDDEARARIAAQMPLAQKIAQADYVIQNDGSLEDTLQQADDVLDAICRRFGVDPARYPR